MKKKLSNYIDRLLSDNLWRVFLGCMFAVVVFGIVYYFINYPKPSRTEIFITSKEFNTGKINDDLNEKDEVKSSASAEDYATKLNALKSQLPTAEWELKEKQLNKEEYAAALAEYEEKFNRIMELKYSIVTSAMAENIPYPDRPDSIKTLTYSMKTFLEDVFKTSEIDSTDYDSKIKILEKIEHFVALSDKKGVDTLLVSKFKHILSGNSKLTLDEIIGAEKTLENITKTKLLFSSNQEASLFQRQGEIFSLYEAVTQPEITAERFTFLDSLANKLKNQYHFKDTLLIVKVVKAAIDIDFSSLKDKSESVDALEIHCANLFFNDPTIKFDEKNVLEKFNKYKSLYNQKIEAANLEKKAREILREENRNSATNYMHFGLSFICMGALIILLIKQNKKD